MKIFIVEDDRFYSGLLKYHLELNPEYEVQVFETGIKYLNAIKEKPDLVCLDYGLPDFFGEELLKRTKKESPNTEVIIVSGQEDVSVAIKLLKEGAYDYVIKDDEARERIWNNAIHINRKKGLENEVKELKEKLISKNDYKKRIFGSSKAINKVFSLMDKACSTNITVSITGETGTGKELVARGIHDGSKRSSKPFVAVNMAAIPKDLIESELFGYEKGAFTGAVNKRIGKFEEANKGTIFLDEIGDLDLALQAKLLRVLQEQEVTRIGNNTPFKIDVRIIVATHQNLTEKVEKGEFRQDLYYRIYGLPITLPPLRDRGNDIVLLAKKFVDEFCKENGLEAVKISNEALETLNNYNFPGNIRELKALVELACVLCDGIIMPEHFKINPGGNLNNILSQQRTLKEYNALIIEHFLEKHDNNVVKVAKLLDVGKSTLYRMINSGEVNNLP